MRNRRGIGLVDTIVALLLVTMAGLVFTAAFPSGFSAVRQGGETKKALALAQQKLEQVKALGYESLTYPSLRAINAIDAEPTDSPYYFTSVDNLASSLACASGKLTISDDTAEVKRAVVEITWGRDEAAGKGIKRTVTLRTLVADKRPWRKP